MAESYKYVAPLANTLGIEVTDLNVAIGLLGDNGIKAGQAGTTLKTGLSRLVKPTKQIKKVMDEYIWIQIRSRSDRHR
jgi:TP901 family phage tail tape measure protein